MIQRNNKGMNIVFILSDDQGAWAMGCAGNSEVITPNLDSLAASGMRFENFFCTSPVCSPARASLFTGMIPSQHGVHDWLRGRDVGKNAIEYMREQLSYTDILAENGYKCGISGKWHLGNKKKKQMSFSHWYVHQRGGGPYYNAPMVKDNKLINAKGYITESITEDALEFITENSYKNNPFYLSVHYTAPHSPWIGNHPKEFTDLYKDCKFESCPQETIHPDCIELTRNVQNDIRGNLIGYYAAITAMDYNIGRILDKLDKLGLRESTMVCFLSDNGFSCGQHGFWGKGNGTFPLNMYDTSVKVPAIFSMPGAIPEGVVSKELLSGYDFMPTILEFAGIFNNNKDNLPGKSFADILLGKNSSGEKNIVVYDEYGSVRMIRTKDWKYIHRFPYGPNEIYNLTIDPDEKINLIDDKKNITIITSLKRRMDEWFVQYVDPELDGIHEAVTGKGQIYYSGIKSQGKPAFK